jgi:hypothetical protein
MRIATFLIAGLGTAAWLLAVGLTLISASDPETTDLRTWFAIAFSILYALTAAPALLLLLYRRAERTAFALAVAFPFAVCLLFVMGVLQLAN